MLPGQQPDAAISGRGEHTVLPGQQPDAAISGRVEQSHLESAVLPGQQPEVPLGGEVTVLPRRVGSLVLCGAVPVPVE